MDPAQKDLSGLVDGAMRVARGIAELPLLDSRTPDEILGYSEFGLPE